MTLGASSLAFLAAVSAWLSAGTLVVSGGDTVRIAALPSNWILLILIAAALSAARAFRLTLAHAWPLAISAIVWLPFLPGPIPDSFLMWQGPLEGAVWLLVIAGLIASRPTPVPKFFVDPVSAPRVAAATLAVLAVIAFSQVRDVIPGGDEPHYLAATQSLLSDGDLRVANNYANGDYLQYFPGRLEPHFLKRSTSGEIYSIHAPGVSFIVLPAFAVSGYGGAVITMILLAALTAALTWRLAWRVSESAAAAWFGVSAVFATAPYFFHTFTIYPEIPGSLCVMCGVWLLLEIDDGRDVDGRSLVAVGAALAVLPWLHSRFAVLAAILGAFIVFRLAARANGVMRIARLLAVPAILGAAWFAYFWMIWGSPNPTSPYGADTSTSASYILRGLIGLLVDQQFGILATAPVYVLAGAGFRGFAGRRPRLALELLVLASTYTMVVASYQMWWAGSAAPARFLVSILPLAALPMASVFARARGEVSSPGVIALMLLIVSLSLVLPRAFVENGRFIFNNRGAFDGTIEWLSQTVDLAAAMPSVHRDGGTIAIRDATAWLVILVLVVWVTSALSRARISMRWATAAIASAAGVMIAATIVWTLHGIAPVTPERAKLGALSAYRPSWMPMLWETSRLRRSSEADFLAAASFELRPGAAARINRVPAGDYQVIASAPSPMTGRLDMFVGRNDPPFESPLVDDLREGAQAFQLRLPVSLLTLNLRAERDMGNGTPWLALRPVSASSPAIDHYATRVARFGDARAFFFDDHAYPEKDGFWTRAGSDATIVIDSPGHRGSGLPISITAGAVDTTIEVTAEGLHEAFSLTSGQKKEVTLPADASGAWTLHVRSGAGFRPSEREAGNRDVRLLSSWIAVQ